MVSQLKSPKFVSTLSDASYKVVLRSQVNFKSATSIMYPMQKQLTRFYEARGSTQLRSQTVTEEPNTKRSNGRKVDQIVMILVLGITRGKICVCVK